MVPNISGCTLHSRGTLPGLSYLKVRVLPLLKVPRLWPSLLLPEIFGQKTLWATLSSLLNTTVVPCWMTKSAGVNSMPR